MQMNITIKQRLKADIPAGIVVFLVALPLCLGIALACRVNPLSGILAGIIGGIVVGLISGSTIGVSGPAAGLTVVVIQGIYELGSYQAFILALVMAGVIQIVLGVSRAGIIAYYFPSAVIRGMLAAIGIILILKQIPHALGYEAHLSDSDSSIQLSGQSTISEILQALQNLHPGAMSIFFTSLFLLIVLASPRFKKYTLFTYIPSVLWMVILTSMAGQILTGLDPSWALSPAQRVQLPVTSSISDLAGYLTYPDITRWRSPDIYLWALTIAAVASLETLLCLEATDKLDPERRITPANRELIAQGIGNTLSGLIGGLPITQVIVRSAANITAGARSALSTVIHGLLLLLSVLLIPHLLNHIPNASLSAILVIVGYKLASYQTHIQVWRLGWQQFLPYITTVFAILGTDLLKGVAIGLLVSLFLILRKNYLTSYYLREDKQPHQKNVRRIILSQEVSFLNKASLMRILNETPENTKLILDGSQSAYIDYDVLEVISNFKKHTAPAKNIDVELIDIEGIDPDTARH